MLNIKKFTIYFIRFILIAIIGLLFYSQIAQIQLVQNANDTTEINISNFDKVVILMSFILPVCTLLLVFKFLFSFTKTTPLLRKLIIIPIINIILTIPSLINIYKLIIDKNTTQNKYLQVITQIYSVLNMLLLIGLIVGWITVYMFITNQ